VALTKADIVRERHVWIAVTAVLATSLAWLATLSLVLLASTHAARFPEALAVLRALARAALAAGCLGGPAALAALGTAGLLIALALRPGARTERRARHA
jgi:hypothetical protein